jgi:LmbE family N-acetylglucosaminyl deacetylase
MKNRIFSKLLALWQRRSFRHKLYQHSQPIEPSCKPTIVFAPHQDDETIGCGGVIALKRQQGVPVKVVFLTDGRNCYQGSPAPIPISAEECVRMRQQEAVTALKTLGVDASDIVFLKHQDSMLGKLELAQRQAAIEEIQQLLQQIRPQEVYLPYYNDMHGDHIETYNLVSAALKSVDASVDIWQYLIWSLWYPHQYLNDLAENNFVDVRHVAIDSVKQQKNEALRAYRSQYVPIVRNFTALPKTFLKFFDSPYELFVKALL